MQNTCSAPGFKSNYRPEIACFRIPKTLPEHKQAWIRLHRSILMNLRYCVCIKYFREDNIEYTHKCQRLTIQLEKSLEQVRSKEWVISMLLARMFFILLQPVFPKHRRLPYDSKEEDRVNQTISLSLQFESIEKEKF